MSSYPSGLRVRCLVSVLVVGCAGEDPGTTTTDATSSTTTGGSTPTSSAADATVTVGSSGSTSTGAGTDAVTSEATTGAASSDGETTAPATGGTTSSGGETTSGTSEGTTTSGTSTSGTSEGTSGTTDTGVQACMTWDYVYGGAQADRGNAVVQVADGGFAIAGRTASSGAGLDDVWLVRLDASGELLWERTYGTPAAESANGLVVAPDGGFLIVGTTASPQTSLDWYVVRTDAEGDELWTNTFATPDADHAFAAVTVAEGGFAVAGTRDRVAQGTGRFWLIRLDDAGEVLWDSVYGDVAQEQLAYGLVAFPQGGFAVAGTAHEDFWVVRTDADGGVLWDEAFDYDPTTYERATGLVRMPDDGLALTGWIQGDGFTDFWVLRTDADGLAVWDLVHSELDHDLAEGAAVTADGGLVVVGTSRDEGEVDDLRMLRLDDAGALVWSRSYGGADYDGGMDVVVVPNEDIVVVGSTLSKGAGELDAWGLRTSPDGLPDCE